MARLHCRLSLLAATLACLWRAPAWALAPPLLRHHRPPRSRWWTVVAVLSDAYLPGDVLTLRSAGGGVALCVVVPDGGTCAPICRREDDVDTELWVDPRVKLAEEDQCDENVIKVYGEVRGVCHFHTYYTPRITD